MKFTTEIAEPEISRKIDETFETLKNCWLCSSLELYSVFTNKFALREPVFAIVGYIASLESTKFRVHRWTPCIGEPRAQVASHFFWRAQVGCTGGTVFLACTGRVHRSGAQVVFNRFVVSVCKNSRNTSFEPLFRTKKSRNNFFVSLFQIKESRTDSLVHWFEI